MSHAKEEAYEELEPAIEVRKVTGFEQELEAIAAAVQAGKSAVEIDALVEKVSAAITAARGPEVKPVETIWAVQRLVRSAADEYGEGVKDGKVVNAGEYQDAWGFVETARRIMAALPAETRERHRQAVTEIETELDKLKPAWPELTGKQPVTADRSLLPAAAARIELAALAIK
jgi:hypothetical protein